MLDTVPPLYSLESCDTVLNEARRLFSDGRFPVHASVISARQTEGRGQHGHRWVSPVGNLYAAIRLPLSAPFTDFRGPLAVSTVIAEALSAAGYTVRIKWPNDIALQTASGPNASAVFSSAKGNSSLPGSASTSSHTPRCLNSGTARRFPRDPSRNAARRPPPRNFGKPSPVGFKPLTPPPFFPGGLRRAKQGFSGFTNASFSRAAPNR